MSILEKAKRTFDMASVAVQAVELVNDIRTGKFPSLTGKSASEILELVYSIAESVIAGFSGNRPIGEVKDEIAQIRSGFEANDARSRSRVDDEFPG